MISTRISGREVTGVVTNRTAENLSVEIISPFHYVMMTAYLPKIILSYANFDDRYGDEWAEILLAHIYEMCAYSWLNIDRLGHEFSKLKEDLAALDELGLEAEEVRYQTYSMKMRFFQTNYPNMNVRESSWNSLLAFIENLRDTPHRFDTTQ